MDALMHLCKKSSTTCHINISVFMDVADTVDIEGGRRWGVVSCAVGGVRVCAWERQNVYTCVKKRARASSGRQSKAAHTRTECLIVFLHFCCLGRLISNFFTKSLGFKDSKKNKNKKIFFFSFFWRSSAQISSAQMKPNQKLKDFLWTTFWFK